MLLLDTMQDKCNCLFEIIEVCYFGIQFLKGRYLGLWEIKVLSLVFPFLSFSRVEGGFLSLDPLAQQGSNRTLLASSALVSPSVHVNISHII